MPGRLTLILRLLLLALGPAVLVACGDRPAPGPADTPPPVEIATATPAPTLTPVVEELGEGSVELLRRGWLSIVDYHISTPDARRPLEAAWSAVAAAAGERGVDAGNAPVLEGDREAMWQAFLASYLAVLHASPEDAWQNYRFEAFAAMTKSLDDCHTFFLKPSRSEVLTDIRTGRPSAGIGVELAPVRPTYVRETVPGGPADAAGVLPGDYVVAVDGQDVSHLGVEVVQELLRGEPGSAISLQVRRPSTGAVLTLPVTRDVVQAPVARGQVLADGSGYIKVRSFTTGSTLREALDGIVADFEAAGVTRWVLDLRDNPGGESDLELAGRFIGGGIAERTLLRDGALEVRHGEGEAYAARPMAVLVNGGTASVAEIFASMLRDHGRARLFGSTTGRCAGFVALETYPDGSTLGVTIARSLSPLGEEPIWQTGVVPDVSVRQTQADIAANRDPVLDAALAWLRTQAAP
jgi:carboxyl-terminal processing protease